MAPSRSPSLVGPIYEETLHLRDGFPAEPFNTVSNLVFLFIVLFWGWRVYRQPREQRFLAGALPLLFVGFVGGTLYHGTRGDPLWLLMDWVPIAVLLLAVAVYFMRRVGWGWLVVGLLISMPFAVFALLRSLGVARAYGPMVGYPLLTVPLLLPLFQRLRRTGWRHLRSIGAAIVIFGCAVTFRTIDRGLGAAVLPGVGTHFLWHLFGGAASFLVVRYVYLDRAPSAFGRGAERAAEPDGERGVADHRPAS